MLAPSLIKFMQGNLKLISILLTALSINLFSTNVDSLLKVAGNPTSSDRVAFFAYYEAGWELVYSKPDTALVLADKALFYAIKMKSLHLEAKAYNLYGSCHQIKQQYIKAINYYKKCQAIGNSLHDDELLVVAFGNLGAMYLSINEYKAAEKYQLLSLTIANKQNSNLRKAAIYNNLSLIYNSEKYQQYNKAVEYANKSLSLYDIVSEEQGTASVHGTLGGIYLNLFELDKALFHFEKALTIDKKLGYIYEEVFTSIEVGDIYYKKKDYDTAINYYTEAFKKAEKINNFEALKDGYEKLSKAFKAKGDIVQALYYHEKFSEATKKYDEYGIKTALQQKELEFEYSEKTRTKDLTYAKKEADIKTQEAIMKANKAQIENERTVRIALLVLLALVVIFAIFMVNRLRIINQQKRIIEQKSKQTNEQKNLLETKNKEVLASINYAKRIQDGILANEQLLNRNLENNFVLFKPKDIVSGDFYWATEHNGLFYLAVCDSTGHGVPGAFMSILNIGLLSEAIKEKNIRSPHEILDYVRQRLIETISGDGQKDGMDGVLMSFDFDLPLIENNDSGENEYMCKILYAAANNQPVLIRNNEMIELAKDKMPIGKGEKTDKFKLYSIGAKKDDMIYIYTDGYADQFGGPNEKKYKYKQLNDQLALMSKLPLNKQKELLNFNFDNWKGANEQVDDVCLFAVKI